MRRLGIIGGLGPEATLDMIQKILALTDAQSDQDHLPLLVDFITETPDRTQAALFGGPSPEWDLAASAQRLEAAGADALVIACNTAYHWLEAVTKSVEIPVWNMIDIAADAIGQGPVGILGTKASLELGLYRKNLEARGISVVEPEDLDLIQEMIYSIKGVNPCPDLNRFEDQLKQMEASGAQVFVLGCTELPIAFQRYAFDVVTIDPTLEVARKAVTWAGGRLKGER